MGVILASKFASFVKQQVRYRRAIRGGEMGVIVEEESLKGVGWQNEPDPTMRHMNPFTAARNKSGRRQTDIAKALGLENATDIIRLEQAIFDRVPAKVVTFYERELGLPRGWQAGYRTFQKLLRRAAPRPIDGVWQMPRGELTFRRWRLHNWPTMSSMGWCKAFCIHPAALYALEKGEQSKIPVQVLEALVEAHIMSDEQAQTFAQRIRQSYHVSAKK